MPASPAAQDLCFLLKTRPDPLLSTRPVLTAT